VTEQRGLSADIARHCIGHIVVCVSKYLYAEIECPKQTFVYCEVLAKLLVRYDLEPYNMSLTMRGNMLAGVICGDEARGKLAHAGTQFMSVTAVCSVVLPLCPSS